MPTERPSERRHSVRTAVVWAGLQPVLDRAPGQDVLDIGGGTGGFAVPLAGLGHRVTVVDPSPDALASLDRRARESGVADRVTGVQGDLGDLARRSPEGTTDSADVVLCHGVLEVVDDPAAALATIGGVLRPGGMLSLLVAQRHAAVVARAMAGHFEQARALLDGSAPGGRAPRTTGRRFTAAELDDLLPAAGFTPVADPRRPGLLRPGARLAARPRAGSGPPPARARAGRRRAAGVPPARRAAPRHRGGPRHPLTPEAVR